MGRLMGKRTLHKLQSKSLNNLAQGHHCDGGGLYFQVSKYETRSWTFRYTRVGKSREMGLGPYPDVSLKEAREGASEARKLLREGADPIEHRNAARSARIADQATALTFKECAVAYIKGKEHEWKNLKHGDQWRNTLETYAYPVIGEMLVRDVELPHVLQILEPIWTSKTETATRLRGRIESIVDYAIVHKYRTSANPARWKGHLAKILPAPNKVAERGHHAALPYREVGAFMAHLRSQSGMGARALEFAILTAVRSGEVRGATWNEVDFNESVWIVPKGRMKGKEEHRVPLSVAAIELLRKMPRVDGCNLIFPGRKGGMQSDATLGAVIDRMHKVEIEAGRKGYTDPKQLDENGKPKVVTQHGFRSSFKDWTREMTNFQRDTQEHALAHKLKNETEAAYARGTMMEKRRRLMNAWAAYCGKVASSATVTPINQKVTA